jgi:ATP-binding cassette subfamily B protein
MFRRYALVRQTDQSDCGAAALATVALHYRRPLGLQQMRDLAGTDRVGTNLLGLIDAAEKLGFAARGVKGPYEGLPGVPLPAVAHVLSSEGLGHFVVVHRVTPKGVVVADPARGIEKLTRAQFCAKWTGYLLLLTPEQQVAPLKAGSAPASAGRRFLSLLAGHTSILIETFFCAILITLLGLASSYFIQHLVDSVLVRHEERLLNALGIGMALVIVFRALFAALRQYLLAHVGRKIDLALTSGYSRHLLRLPLRFFEMRRVGEILSRVNDASKVREAVSGTATTAMVDTTLVVLMVMVLWIYDWPLALVASAFVPLLLFSVMIHHPASRRRSREAMEQGAQLSAHLVEDISGVETVKAFGAERQRTEDGEARLVGFLQSCFSLRKLGMSMAAVGTLVTAVAGLAVLWYGGHRVMAGYLTIGQLMFFYSLLGHLLEPLQRLTSINLQLQDALVAVNRLYEVLDVEAEPLGDVNKVEFSGLTSALELQDVSFRYGCRANVLDKVSLVIPAGQTVAIVGASGSGKSTLLKLLMSYYSPTDGRVLLDGQNMQDFELTSLRQRIGLVSQEPFIFTGTLRENISLGRPDATLTEVMAAARAAGLEEFVAALPQRYETLIGERGANMSGGQRQRLAIARVLLRQPDILIFDEATSHLDTATERAIQENLRFALAGKTVVLVAHRLSTIKDADRIYVLHQGHIVEEGTHRQLLAQRGRYAALVQCQSDDQDTPNPRTAVDLGNERNRYSHHERVSHA